MSEQIEENKIDRTGWTAGEWDNEPDRVDFIHAGYSCMLLRGPVGAWCGYVGVPKAHPVFGKHYDDVNVNVHGGLTYADKCKGPICHKPIQGMPKKVWWLGFDCAHAFDLAPKMLMYAMEYREKRPGSSLFEHKEDVYRDMDYARQETEHLAEQLASYVPEKFTWSGLRLRARRAWDRKIYGWKFTRRWKMRSLLSKLKGMRTL